jgi:hypothetical protein
VKFFFKHEAKRPSLAIQLSVDPVRPHQSFLMARSACGEQFTHGSW